MTENMHTTVLTGTWVIQWNVKA